MLGGVVMNNRSKTALAVCSAVMAVIFTAVVIFAVSCQPKPDDAKDTAGPASGSVSTAAVSSEPETIVLSFIGDCVIASEASSTSPDNFDYYAKNKSHEYFFSGVYDILSKDDLTFANVECVLSDKDLEKSYKDYSPAFWFKGPSSYADIMRLGSVEVAGVVNNHTKDYGFEGYQDTVKSLKNEGLEVGEDCVPIYADVKGSRIGVVYAHLWGSSHLSYIKDALEDMQDRCDYRIVFFHGGDEGVHEPDNYKIDCLRELANSGLCDLIVGSHPHVLQPMEIVNGVPIVYSLGNFCYAGSYYPENKTVIFQVLLTVDGDRNISTATRLIPCYVFTGSYNNWQPMVITDKEDSEAVLAIMNSKVEYRQSTGTEAQKPTDTHGSEQTGTSYDPPEDPDYTEEPTFVEDTPQDDAENDTVIVYY